MAVMIRSPSRGNPRHPDVAVACVDTPGAVVVQVLIADEIGRNVPYGLRSIIVTVSILTPGIKRIVGIRSID
jgi:hypothetical protein